MGRTHPTYSVKSGHLVRCQYKSSIDRITNTVLESPPANTLPSSSSLNYSSLDCLAVSDQPRPSPSRGRAALRSLSASSIPGWVNGEILASRPSCPGKADKVRELREPPASGPTVRTECTLRAIMMQLTMTSTEMTVTPRMASRIVPAGGLSKGGEFEGSVDGSVDV